MRRKRLESGNELGFGQEEVSTSRGSRFRLECKWQMPAPFLRADSMAVGVKVQGEEHPSSHGQGQ